MTATDQRLPAETARIFDCYRTMLTIRAFDEAAGRAHKDGQVRGSVHQYIGEEAIATGVCANLRPDDLITSFHRGHGHSIAKGADPTAMMKELFGRAGGTSAGKGGSMHIADFSVGMLGANGVVADGATIAVGAAQGLKLQGKDAIVVAFIGDGALNRGPLLESLNWAAVFGLRVLFVCEDNEYAVSTKSKSVTAGPGAVARAESFGIHGVSIDGNDIVQVDQTCADLVERVRTTGQPAFLHARTYRLRGHLAHDPANYRDPKEVEAHLADEPIGRCETWLRERGVTPDALDAARHDAAQTITAALDAAAAAPWPDDASAWTDVQDLGGPL
jgi:pyruvate dehydrogenase E1 component alpha subunit